MCNNVTQSFSMFSWFSKLLHCSMAVGPSYFTNHPPSTPDIRTLNVNRQKSNQSLNDTVAFIFLIIENLRGLFIALFRQ